jgi:8-oxo-dGTP diphosphatase
MAPLPTRLGTCVTVLRRSPAASRASLQVLLIQRNTEPFRNHFALPGGRMDPADASLLACATRELREETGLSAVLAPRPYRLSHVVSAQGDAVFALHHFVALSFRGAVRAGSDAKQALWVDAANVTQMQPCVPELAAAVNRAVLGIRLGSWKLAPLNQQHH